MVMGDIDRVLEKRISGSPSATIRHLMGTLPRSISTAGTMQRLEYVSRLGTQPYLGRLGTMRYQGRLGTMVYANRLGTLGARAFAGTVPRDRKRLGASSLWTGSWHDVRDYHIKTVVFKHHSGTTGQGSYYLMAGMAGTKENHGTFTLASGRMPRGSATVVTVDDAIMYLRPKVQQSGVTSGTVSMFLGRQV
jgi:hypothetical protein